MRFRGIAEIAELYRQWGDHMYDEEVSQTTHAVQCARRARRDGASTALTVAALLHDVGHLLEIRSRESAEVVADVDLRHQDTGAEALAGVFDERVVEPIRWHVAAKRFLCATDADYAASLSAGSTASLVLQGGPMSGSECADFLRIPHSGDAIRLRRWDDLGKDIDDAPATFAAFEQLLHELVDELDPGH